MARILLTSQYPPSNTNEAYEASLKIENGSGRGAGMHILRTPLHTKANDGSSRRLQKSLLVLATANTYLGDLVWIRISASSSRGMRRRGLGVTSAWVLETEDPWSRRVFFASGLSSFSAC